jgi:hypothetical protein
MCYGKIPNINILKCNLKKNYRQEVMDKSIDIMDSKFFFKDGMLNVTKEGKNLDNAIILLDMTKL